MKENNILFNVNKTLAGLKTAQQLLRIKYLTIHYGDNKKNTTTSPKAALPSCLVVFSWPVPTQFFNNL